MTLDATIYHIGVAMRVIGTPAYGSLVQMVGFVVAFINTSISFLIHLGTSTIWLVRDENLNPCIFKITYIFTQLM